MRLLAIGVLLAMLVTSSVRAEASIEHAFDGALKAINDERSKNNANQFGCTQFFTEFYRGKKIELYVVFFKSRGI